MSESPELQFKKLVQRVLNEEFLLGLQGGVKLSISGRTYDFELVDKTKNHYVDIETNFQSLNRAHLFNKIRPRIASLKTRANKLPFYYILVFNVKISNNDREYLESGLFDQSRDFLIFDINDIIDLAKKHSINTLEFGIPDNSYTDSNERTRNDLETKKVQSKTKEDVQSHNNSTQDQALNFLEFAKKHDIDFFIVQSRFNNRDYSFEWKRNQKWEYQEKGANPVSKNDILFMHSGISVSNNLAVMSIGLVGHVFENNNCNVDWADFEGKSINAFKEDDKDTVKKITSENYLFDIIKNTFDFHPSLKTRLENEILKHLNWERSKPEVHIDEGYTFSIGLEVGVEIRDYDVIFLPKSSHGGIGQNGIAAHILELLGRDRTEIEFSSQDLEKIGYKWVSVYTETKSIEVCFVVSKDINKNSLNFSDNLKNAIYNFSGAMSALNPPSEVTKIFIPLLGTGQAQLPVADSFNIINDVLHLFNEYFKNSQIRINFPLDIEKDVLLNYAKDVITFHKLNEIGNLRQKINRLFDNEDDQLPLNNIDPTKDKIPFHLDNVETIDKLNREPVAKSLARLINAEIFDNKKMNYSFMVHLQGEWGSGKSTFLNLVKQNLDTEKRKWVVINYNAWQNQHISPPWWSFIDQIYRQAVKKPNNLNWLQKRYIIAKEKSRRIIKYSSAYKALTFSIAVLLILILFNYKTEIAAILTNLFSSDSTQETKGILTAEELKDLLLTVSAIVGVIILLAKFFSTPLLMQSSKEAISFMHRAADPMNKIKEHFNSLIGDINNMKFDVAVFIDDIDRCNRKYTVELLEGIQTLFKEKKVLYIVAGDKSWITSCFENNYDEFSKNLTSKGENLGDLFLEKAFQLSIRMPEVSEKSKESFWKDIIGAKEESKDEEKTKLTEAQRNEIKKIVVDNYNNNENNSTTLNNLENKYNISSEEASDLAIEALDENVEDVRHLLLSFHKSLNPNPRSIKRLANYYTMYRNTLIAEKADFLPTKLFRWLLLEDKYPILVRQFLKEGEIDKVDEFIKSQNYSSQQKDDLLELLDGSAENNEEPLRMEELIKILRK